MNKNGEDLFYLEITEVVLVIDYQQDPGALYAFISNNLFGQLSDISPKSSIFLKTFDAEFSYIEVWFTNQNPKPLEIKDKINITLVIN